MIRNQHLADKPGSGSPRCGDRNDRLSNAAEMLEGYEEPRADDIREELKDSVARRKHEIEAMLDEDGELTA